ncbi:MAG: LysR family transcriptional regulator [Nannocystales bacterium]
MDWDDLRVFLALVREGTVLGAAESLGLARSTINRRFDALEHSVKTSLLERGPNGLELTEAGEALMPVAERMEDSAHEALRAVSSQQLELSGRVVLTVFEAACVLLAPALAQLHQVHPKVELRVVSSPRALRLDRRESDLAIRATRSPSPHLFGRQLGRLQHGVYGRRGLVGSKNPPWVLPDESLGATETWALARASSSPLHVAARVDSLHCMLSLVRAGAGVAVLPTRIAESIRGLVPRGPATRDELDMPVWVLTHPDLRRVARIRMLMRFLAEHVAPLL